MAFDETSPPKKRWQQQSCSTTPSPSSFTLDATQWQNQSVLVFDESNGHTYRMGSIQDIVDSHIVTISLRDESQSFVTIDLARTSRHQMPSVIIDNIPARQDLEVGTEICARQTKQNQNYQFVCGRIKEKHPTRLEFSIDFKDSNNNLHRNIREGDKDDEEIWFTRQNIRLLIEPWHEELRLHRENLASSTVFRPISLEINSAKTPSEDKICSPSPKTAFPTPPIENKDEDDEEVERELQKQPTTVNKLQGVKKGDIFTMG